MVNFSTEYQALDDDAILRIAADRENLLQEAQQALDSELLRRKLTQSDIGQYQAHIERAEIEEQARLPFISHYGIGKRFLGKRAYVSDPVDIWEEFDTELWIVVFWIPLIPIATFRVRRIKKFRLFGPWQNCRFNVINKRGRDWMLILSTWAWFCFTLLTLATVLKFIVQYPHLFQ